MFVRPSPSQAAGSSLSLWEGHKAWYYFRPANVPSMWSSRNRLGYIWSQKACPALQIWYPFQAPAYHRNWWSGSNITFDNVRDRSIAVQKSRTFLFLKHLLDITREFRETCSAQKWCATWRRVRESDQAPETRTDHWNSESHMAREKVTTRDAWRWRLLLAYTHHALPRPTPRCLEHDDESKISKIDFRSHYTCSINCHANEQL